MSHQNPVAGDRYEWDGLRITVSSVDPEGEVAQLRIYDPMHSTVRFKYQQLPLPSSYVWVGNTETVLMCERCRTQPAAAGMAYCDDCIDVLAATWGG